MKKTVLLCHIAAVLAVFVLSLWIFSCRSMEGVFRAPSVSLRSVDIAGISLKGVDLLCQLDVENPNAVDIPFPEIGWELFINAGIFLSGTVENQESIKARGLTVLNVPVSLSYEEILNTFKSFKGGQDVDYTIALETRFLLPVLGEMVRNFDYKGKIPLVRMIAFGNPSMRIERLDFSGADIVCSVDIDNPNAFPLPFPQIDYNYAVRNNSFITGTVESPGSLAAGARTPAEIRLQVVFSDLYRSIPSLRTVGEAGSLLSLSSLVSLPGFEEEKFSLEIPGSLPLLKVPVLSFRGISVKNISLSKIDLEFGWDLDNPNSFAFDVNNLEYSFLVNNNTWAQGNLAAKTNVAAGKKASIPVAVSISTPALVKDLTDIITRGVDVNYELAGTAAYDSSLRFFSGSSLPFNFSGRTKLRR
ncbi:MAG: LEA type 2 family protein [Treponema sp.]|nr:LEA type 2 family protein [Treponema sp.]